MQNQTITTAAAFHSAVSFPVARPAAAFGASGQPESPLSAEHAASAGQYKALSHDLVSAAADPVWLRKGRHLRLLAQQLQEPLPVMPARRQMVAESILGIVAVLNPAALLAKVFRGERTHTPTGIEAAPHALSTQETGMQPYLPAVSALPVAPALPVLQRLRRAPLNAADADPDAGLNATTPVPASAMNPQTTAASLAAENEELLAFLSSFSAGPGKAVTAGALVKMTVDFWLDYPEYREDLARSILRDKAYFGGCIGEEVSAHYQSAAVHDWVALNLFQGSVHDVLVRLQAAEPDVRLSTASLREKLRYMLYASGVLDTEDDVLEQRDLLIVRWIWTHVVVAAAPMLQTSQEQIAESWSVSDLRWGQMHAGLLFNQWSGVSSEDVTRMEALELGRLLLEYWKQGSAPAQWGALFGLPALLRYASCAPEVTRDAGIAQPAAKWLETALTDYLQLSNQTVSSSTAFNQALLDFKPRLELAQAYLEQHCPGMDVHAYVHQGEGDCTDDQARHLQDIDTVYSKQVQDLAELFMPIDQFLLQSAWFHLDKAELDFLLQSDVQQMHAHFSRAAPLPHYQFFGAERARHHRIKLTLRADAELWAATQEGEQRIYALYEGERGYQIMRVDRNRQHYVDVLVSRPTSIEAGDELHIHAKGAPLEQFGDRMDALVQRIAAQHRERFRHEMHSAGYQQTTREKVRALALSLVPFYTCITEARDGNTGPAIFACTIDGVTLVPLAGMAASLGVKGGRHLGRAGTKAIQRMSMQAGARTGTRVPLHSLLGQGATVFVRQGVQPALRLFGKKELLALSREAALLFDPGFSLLGHIGKASFKRFLRFGEQMQHGLPTLHRSLQRLNKRAFAFPEAELASDMQAPLSGMKNVPAASIKPLDGDRFQGHGVVVRQNPETGAVGGPKYTLDHSGQLVRIPLPVARRLRNLQQQGLSGRGAARQGVQWGRQGDANAAPQGRMAAEHDAGIAEIELKHFDEWERMTPEQRRMERSAFVIRHQIDYDSWMRWARVDKPFSEAGLTRKLQLEGYTYRHIDGDDIELWLNSKRAGQEMDRNTFAVSRGISPTAWAHIISKNGELSALGRRRREQFLANDAAITDFMRHPEPVPAQQSRQVVAPVPAEAQEQALDLSLRGAAGRQSAQSALDADYREITASHLRQWQALTQAHREHIGLAEFARRHQLDPGMLSSLVRDDGSVTGQGLKLLNRARLQAATQEMP